jgi:hypothetical protein
MGVGRLFKGNDSVDAWLVFLLGASAVRYPAGDV